MATDQQAVHTAQGPFGTMGLTIKRKLRNDNDSKVLVVGANSQTGIGKTTFAIALCRYLDETSDGWSAGEKAYIDIPEYIEAHMQKPKKTALLLDEIEAGADSRRASSHDNVNLSKAWSTMRDQNIATVATLPSVSMLDGRMLELADYWVLVKQRGVAQPFKINVNDFNGRVQRKPINANKDGVGEHITFPDLPIWRECQKCAWDEPGLTMGDGDECPKCGKKQPKDPDKEYLNSIKDDTVWSLTESAQKLTVSEHKKKLKKAKKDMERETRNNIVRGIYHCDHIDASTTDLSKVDEIGISQSQVSEVINSEPSD